MHKDHYFLLLETFDPILFTLCLLGALAVWESDDLRVWLGWCLALDESSKLQKCVVFCVSVNNFDGNHLKFWVSQVRVLYNISDFLLKPPPKQGNNNMGSVTIFYFFSPLLIFRRWSFFWPAQKVEVFGGSSSMAWAVGASSPVWRLVEAQKCRR